MEKDKRVDEYIANAQHFARPILKYLRTLVHENCPGVTETIKWGFPHFDYHGKILCGMAAFKHHCAFNLWLASHLNKSNKSTEASKGMGIFGKITSLQTLPTGDEIVDLLHKAMELTDTGKTVQRKRSTKNTITEIPEDFFSLLDKNHTALENFLKFSPSKKKDYIEWITEARTETTRVKRMITAIEWITEGKSRNWKYQQK